VTPDPESFRREDYVGRPADDAAALAEERGWTVRRLTPDSVVTMEYREGRLNLIEDDGVVVSAHLG
jgi:hypothetical protein